MSEKLDLLDFLPVKTGTSIEYRKGELVCTQGSSQDPRIFMVQSGILLLETRVGLGIVHHGEVFGVEVMCGLYTVSARCLEPSKVMYWDVEDLLGGLGIRQEFNIALMQWLVDQNTSLQRKVERLHTMRTKDRLKAFLVDMAARYGGVPGEDGMISIPYFGHREIASLIGTTREAVTHLMGQLREEGLISFKMRSPICVSPALMEGRGELSRAAEAAAD